MSTATMKITTNNATRPIIDAWELTEQEQKEFDYLDWEAIKEGRDSASFVRYQDTLYDLGEFSRIIAPDARRHHPMECAEPAFQDWQGYMSDSFFSGLLIRYVDDESVIVARYSC